MSVFEILVISNPRLLEYQHLLMLCSIRVMRLQEGLCYTETLSSTCWQNRHDKRSLFIIVIFISSPYNIHCYTKFTIYWWQSTTCLQFKPQPFDLLVCQQFCTTDFYSRIRSTSVTLETTQPVLIREQRISRCLVCELQNSCYL